MAYAKERALGQAYFDTSMAAPVTPDQLKKAYDALVAAFKPVDEVHAKHILVASQDDAKAIKAQIDGGASFEDLAKSKSTDTGSAANGGDLGFFSHDQMVKPFADAAFALDVGKVSDPVQSQFGWHIIKVEEKRKSAPPTLEAATPQLEQQIRLKTFTDAITGLKKGLAINIPDPALAAAVTAKANAAPGN
jgi:peptidyl-prolyl cis-trans isomerase C